MQWYFHHIIWEIRKTLVLKNIRTDLCSKKIARSTKQIES